MLMLPSETLLIQNVIFENGTNQKLISLLCVQSRSLPHMPAGSGLLP